ASIEEQRRLEVWQEAAVAMADYDEALKNWLLKGLARERLHTIRIDAIHRIRSLAHELRARSEVDEAGRRKQLNSLLQESLKLAADPSEKIEIRELALEAIGDMPAFRNEPEVMELLRGLIARVRRTESTITDRSLGLAAIRVAGELGADFGSELEQLLREEVGERSGARPTWAKVDATLVVQILETLRSSCFSAEALPNLLAIFEISNDDTVKDLVLQVFRGNGLDKFSPEGKRTILAFYARLVEDRASPFVSKAIAGIDYLRIPEGLAILDRLASDAQVVEADRLASLEAIRSIGGEAALHALSLLISRTDGAVRARALDCAVQLVVNGAEGSIEALHDLLIVDATVTPPEIQPWFQDAIGRQDVSAILVRDWPAESADQRGTSFTQWVEIEHGILAALETSTDASAQIDEARLSYRRIQVRAQQDSDAIGGADSAKELFDRFRSRADARANVLAGLSAGDFAAASAAVGPLVTSPSAFESTVTWLLDCVGAAPLRDGESEFFDQLVASGTERGFTLPQDIESKIRDRKKAPKAEAKAPDEAQ
ncbi:MAG: hypothetical protein KDC38_11815, partial [Planctomycetes bacterium]|nr:hypothetical protein [Planctomycetota bacterium]